MSGVHFRAVVLKTQTNQKQRSQRPHWRSHFPKPPDLLSDWTAASLEVLTQVQQVVLAAAQTTFLLVQLNGNQESSYYQEQRWPESLRIFLGQLFALAVDSAIFSRIKERFPIRASFVLTLNQGSRDLPVEANPDLWTPAGRSFLTQQCNFWGTDQWAVLVCEHLGAQLGNLRGITEVCASHPGIHRPKENNNHHRQR